MNYREAREYVNTNTGIVPGLNNIRRLCALLGNPQDKLRTIHIAGTNGKGSTGAFIAATLQNAGMTAGHFSSPAVFEYLGQWQINGKNINEDDYCGLAAKIKAITDSVPDLHPTPFEIETALAFMYFYQSGCGAAVIEVGMGGSEDATNIIENSLVSVITPIALDHVRFLGGSIEDIAAAKAGIIKENGTVVTTRQSPEVMEIIQQTAARKHAKLYVADSETDYKLSLEGDYQRQNAALAAEVCRHINGVSEENIAYGLSHTVWRGRFEKICGKPLFITDGAHNPHGAAALSDSINRHFKNRRIIYITGVFSDKDYEKIAEITAPAADKIYTITPPSPRGLDNKILADTFNKFNPCAEPVTLSEALRLSLKETDAVVIAFGSLSFIGELSRRLNDIISMQKCSRILHNAEFRQLLSKIFEAENDRIYCRHGIEHLMDVARAAQILNLECNLGIPKDIVYGAALMHDIGRWAQYEGKTEHHTASAEAARKILPQCGYNSDEVCRIAEAILTHRKRPLEIKTLADIIASADKDTRLCMLCPASDTCKWKKSEQNDNLTV